MQRSQLEAVQVTSFEFIFLTLQSEAPYRPHSMNDKPRGEPATFRQLRLASFASTKRATFFAKFRAGCAMDCSIHTTSTEQRVAGGVDNRIHVQGGYVGVNGFQRSHMS